MKSINVLAFPGTNCEVETARAIRQAGFTSKILRWNDDLEAISASDGIVIAGGFSYEDRGRSGVVAAAGPVRDVLIRMDKAGKPILGICNGAQVLVETGLVPGLQEGEIEMALARNRRQKNGEILGTGFYHDFVYMKQTGKKCAWTNFEGIVRLPIAHGEGRFLASDEVLATIMENGQTALAYCDVQGQISAEFPVNPNGSMANLAAVSNPRGNVLAMMPHPERAEDGQKIFRSLHAFFAADAQSKFPEAPQLVKRPHELPSTLPKKPQFTVELFVFLKITDNIQKTIEWAARRALNMPELSLKRSQYWGIATEQDPQAVAKAFIASGEFFNENKEIAYFKIGRNWFRAEGQLLAPAQLPASAYDLLSMDKDDVVGMEKSALLKKHSGLDIQVHSGVYWSFSHAIDEVLLQKTALFANPVSGNLFKETTVV